MVKKGRSKIQYILENIYLEVLILYTMLFFALGIPVFRTVVAGVINLPIMYIFRTLLYRMAYPLKFFISIEAMAILSLGSMLIIILTIVAIRLRRRIFLRTLLLYNLFKNYNNDFKVYTGAILPVVLAMVYFLNYIFSYNYTYPNTMMLLIVAIITISLLHYADQTNKIVQNIKNMGSDQKRPIVDGCISYFTAESINRLDSIEKNVQESIDNQLKSERLKTELITNISHDLKTPLTSIINYTDLLKGYEFESKTIMGYISALERNSQRLKILISDLIDASKTETGNVKVNIEKLELNELISQVYGEFDRIFNEKNINFIFNPGEDVFVLADGSHLGRVLENIIGNASKYTLENTRIYGLVEEEGSFVSFILKNVSKDELNISPDELMEQFVRGERSRHTEGSGLGLYIAKNLMKLMKGELSLSINGDLFEVKILIPKADQ